MDETKTSKAYDKNQFPDSDWSYSTRLYLSTFLVRNGALISYSILLRPGAHLSGSESATMPLPTIWEGGGSMRAILALMCLFWDAINDIPAESLDAEQESGVDKH
jgi:hypothetical protein